MKFKYYMRGFGAGLIIATIVLMVAGKIQNNNKALVTDNNENQRTGSVIAFTTESSTEGTENAESETETESQKQENESTIQATTVSETKTETVASQEASTQRPTVKITTGDGSGEVELVFSGVYTAAQAADILFDAGIIDNKTEFIHICILPDMTEKCVMVHTDLNLAIHMIRLLKQLRKQNKKILAIYCMY